MGFWLGAKDGQVVNSLARLRGLTWGFLASGRGTKSRGHLHFLHLSIRLTPSLSPAALPHSPPNLPSNTPGSATSLCSHTLHLDLEMVERARAPALPVEGPGSTPSSLTSFCGPRQKVSLTTTSSTPSPTQCSHTLPSLHPCFLTPCARCTPFSLYLTCL